MNPIATFVLGVCIGSIGGMLLTCLLVMAREAEEKRQQLSQLLPRPAVRLCDECTVAPAKFFCTTHACYVCEECVGLHPVMMLCRHMSIAAAQEWARSLGAHA